MQACIVACLTFDWPNGTIFHIHETRSLAALWMAAHPQQTYYNVTLRIHTNSSFYISWEISWNGEFLLTDMVNKQVIWNIRGLITCFLQGKEWNKNIVTRKSLDITWRKSAYGNPSNILTFKAISKWSIVYIWLSLLVKIKTCGTPWYWIYLCLLSPWMSNAFLDDS